MLNETTHDFGVVATGAKVEHRFIVENLYEEDANIKSVTSSCGCSSPQVNPKSLKTWEKAEILVTLDTRGFLGRKDATITVEFDKPYSAEVQLHVHAYIRSDIVVQPGAVTFGSVIQGEEAKQVVSINYAGRMTRPAARQIRSALTRPSRPRQSRRIDRPAWSTYSMSVRLKPMPRPGYFRDQLTLVTNDYDVRGGPGAGHRGRVGHLGAERSAVLAADGRGAAWPAVTRNLVLRGKHVPYSCRTSERRALSVQIVQR